MQLIDGRYPQLKQAFSSHHSERPSGSEVSLLVIHNISLPAGEFGHRFIHDLFLGCLDTSVHSTFTGLAGLCVAPHFLIDREGEVTQFVSVDRSAWHAGESAFEGVEHCNDYSLGIELEGSDFVPFTDAQYRSLRMLSDSLMRDFKGITKERIVGHSDIAPARKTDPGPCFDWKRFLDGL